MEPADPKPEQREVSHELPEPPPVPPYLGTDAPNAPRLQPLPEEPDPTARAGQVVLDLSMGEFIIRPGPADQPIRVEADYDSNAFELVEELTRSEDDSWTYQISFLARAGGLFGMLFSGHHDAHNRVEITIPRDHPLDIVGKVALGESEFDLSGLWLRDFDVDFGAGDHFVEFREPAPVPMDRFRLDASIGEVEVRYLGEASPATVDVDQNIGELFLDLQGSWRQDSQVDIDFGIGECRLWLPDNVRVDIERARVNIGESSIDRPKEELPEDAPTLTLNMTGNIGEVRIEY